MIERAAELIDAAQRPVIYGGGGICAAMAHGELLTLAEQADIPVTMTLMGKGGFPDEHELGLGMPGMHGTAYANYALHEADLIIAVGTRFDDRVTGKLDMFAPGAKFIHIDVDPAEIGKNVAVALPIVGDVKSVLATLVKKVAKTTHPEWHQQILEWKRKHPLKWKEDGGLKPQSVIREIHGACRGEAIITTEVGQNQMWAAQFYDCREPRQFISSGGLGTMGYGFPAAIGAQFARPDRVVWDIAGDGSIQMNIQEMATAVVNKLPIKIAVLNNGYLGMVRQWQTLFHHNRLSFVDLNVGSPDFVKLAEAYGAVGLRVTEASGCVPRSPQSTTRRLETIAALRSSSSSTMSCSASRASAIWTIPTAPSTIRDRAATTALACWRCSMTWAISGAYESRVILASMTSTPAGTTRAAISVASWPAISSVWSRRESASVPALS